MKIPESANFSVFKGHRSLSLTVFGDNIALKIAVLKILENSQENNFTGDQ